LTRDSLLGYDDGSVRDAFVIERRAKAGTQRQGRHSEPEGVEFQGRLECGVPLLDNLDQNPNPNRSGCQPSPLVQGQFSQPARQAFGQERWSLHLVTRELEVGSHVGVARGYALCKLISRDGSANLAGLEQRVAPVEIDRLRHLARLDQLLVSG